MKILVVYDSVFGNTEKIAQAVAQAAGQAIAGEPGTSANVELLHVSGVQLSQMEESDLLVVGSPTRGFRPTEDLAHLLERLAPKALQGRRVAAFDTRLKADEQKSIVTRFVVKTGGYAARRIAERLVKAGAVLIVPPEGFYVADTEGPLKDGELERAAAWAKSLLK